MPNNYDRGMIKWLPFNSIVSGKKLINEILDEKKKINMPIISEDDKTIIEKSIINSFYQKSSITLSYFYDGNIKTISGKIKKIDFIYNKIYLNNTILIFDQIIKTNLKEDNF